MSENVKPSPCLIVIFGASGDLTRRKLIPSLYDLFVGGQLPQAVAVLGISRSAMSDDEFRGRLKQHARQFAHQFDDESWGKFEQLIYYHAGDSTVAGDFSAIKKRIGELAARHETGENVLFYLSLAPQLYEPTIVNLSLANMVTEGKAWCSLNRMTRPWQRVIVEKPFGHDPKSAAHLNRVLGRVFEEEDTYRIDHYLGKETVQNLLVFRFGNSIFEPIWNRNYIDHVQVTAAESVDVGDRGGYYDSESGGAMRDMIQSHLLQVMAMIAMEPPVSMRADDIRAEVKKVLIGTRTPGGWGRAGTAEADEIADIAVRGQYGPGEHESKAIDGYRQTKGVDSQSQTDTYAALQVFIDTWRWQGVPFYLRSGKAMARKTTELVVTFKATHHALFRDPSTGKSAVEPNKIIINIQPGEGIRLRFSGKVPGTGMQIKPVVMDFDYCREFNAEPTEAYATLLLDAMRGDQTLFKHRDEIENCWRIVQPVLDYWAANPQEDLPNYAAGTWGPVASDDMMARDDRAWHNAGPTSEGRCTNNH